MNCGLCGGGKRNFLFYSGEYRIASCADCGLVRTENFAAGLASYSGEEYFLRKNQYVGLWDEFCAVLEPLVDKIAGFKSGGKLLDVGAGVGILLSLAARRGFDVKGIEISEWASAFARDKKGLDVATGTLEGAGLPAGSFDVVVINHVLEHVERPRELLAAARLALKEDGLLVVGTPNIDSLMARLRRGRWVSLRPQEHIWHFSPATLTRLLALAGFKVELFEARENHAALGWGPAAALRRAINLISVWADRSEAMLVFARKE